MATTTSKIRNILCPTDLSPRSQAAVTVAAGIASHLSAKLTACHCVGSNWFTTDHAMPQQNREKIESEMKQAIVGRWNGSSPDWNVRVIENSDDPARDIVKLASDLGVELIVLKARKGVRSALHYGSMVERITRGASVPVLLLPSKYLEAVEQQKIDFHQVLFDYDFSETTDQLFPFAMEMTKGFNANLHLLAVLEPPKAGPTEAGDTRSSRDMLRNATRQKLNHVIENDAAKLISSEAVVEWGRHADTVLRYAEQNNIDLICTTLSPAYFYYEKLYCAYLGQLLQSAKCPILALRSV